MLAVFAFLGVLVLSMALLQFVVDRLPGPADSGATRRAGAAGAPGETQPGAPARGTAGRFGARRRMAAERAAVAAAAAALHAHRTRPGAVHSNKEQNAS